MNLVSAGSVGAFVMTLSFRLGDEGLSVEDMIGISALVVVECLWLFASVNTLGKISKSDDESNSPLKWKRGREKENIFVLYSPFYIRVCCCFYFPCSLTFLVKVNVRGP